MKYLTHYAAVPQGGSAAGLGRTGKSNGWSQTLLYGGLGVMTGIVAVKVFEHFCPSHNHAVKKHCKKRKVVDIEVEEVSDESTPEIPDVEVKAVAVEAPAAEADAPIEVRIRQLRAEGKTYPAIARELHVSISVISRVLKADV